MRSPFPGMDPFLENPIGWPDVHGSLIAAIRDELAGEVSPAYHVRMEERIYVTSDDDAGYPRLVPDVLIASGRPGVQAPRTAGAIITRPTRILGLLDPEIHDRYLVVRDGRNDRVVTAIEVLSPANKVRGSHGREAMVAKRDLLLVGGASWVEIDLLREGVRSGQVANRSDYCVTLRRPATPGLDAWFIDLRDALPTVAIPLSEPHPDAPLDLQAVFTGVYERAHYADSTDYDQPIVPPLAAEGEAWARERIAAWRGGR